MDQIQRIWDKCKTLYASIREKVSVTVNTAFPKTERKYAFYGILALVEALIAYGIAVFDIGIWINDCSLPGIIAGYYLQKRWYPLLLFLLLGGALLLLVYFYLASYNNGNTGRGFSISDSNVYGSARDINMQELQQVAEIVPKEQAMGAILGQLDKSEKRLITAKNLVNFNKNTLCLAPPGSGKTFCIVLNSIVQAIRRGESVITTDTKGELWAKTVEYARAHGYIVKRFDLKNPRCSDGLDLLGEMHNDDIRAKIAANIIMKNTGNEKDIHAAAEEALLAAVCMYQDLNDAIPPEEKTLYNAFAMLFSGATALDNTFNSIKYDPHMKVAYDSYATFLQGSPNLRGNIITGLANRLSLLSSPAIKDMTSCPDIDLTLPGKKKCIYYCEMPDQHDALKFLATLFFSFLLLDLTDFADAQMDQMLPVPVNVMIEEAYAVGELPTITNALSTVRSRGIGITLIAQGISQFHILYGEQVTNTILNSCATFACLGSNTSDTSELFSWMGGEATVKVKTEQHTVGEGPIRFGRNYSTGDGRQALYTGNDIRKIPFGRIFLVWQRFDPIMAYTFGIDRHPEFMKGKMPKILANTHIELADKEARAFLNAMEEQRVMDYEEWLSNGGDPWADYGTPEPACDGPARGTKPPEVIPYPELEKMALEHSRQANLERKDRQMRELQQQDPVMPEEGFEPITIPEDFAWDETDLLVGELISDAFPPESAATSETEPEISTVEDIEDFARNLYVAVSEKNKLLEEEEEEPEDDPDYDSEEPEEEYDDPVPSGQFVTPETLLSSTIQTAEQPTDPTPAANHEKTAPAETQQESAVQNPPAETQQPKPSANGLIEVSSEPEEKPQRANKRTLQETPIESVFTNTFGTPGSGKAKNPAFQVSRTLKKREQTDNTNK